MGHHAHRDAAQGVGSCVNAPLDPRWRLVLIAVRRALLIVADALAVCCELQEAGVR
jgi:hypothetical protein